MLLTLNFWLLFFQVIKYIIVRYRKHFSKQVKAAIQQKQHHTLENYKCEKGQTNFFFGLFKGTAVIEKVLAIVIWKNLYSYENSRLSFSRVRCQKTNHENCCKNDM